MSKKIRSKTFLDHYLRSKSKATQYIAFQIKDFIQT